MRGSAVLWPLRVELGLFIKLQKHLALLELFPCLILKYTTANTHANKPVEKRG